MVFQKYGNVKSGWPPALTTENCPTENLILFLNSQTKVHAVMKYCFAIPYRLYLDFYLLTNCLTSCCLFIVVRPYGQSLSQIMSQDGSVNYQCQGSSPLNYKNWRKSFFIKIQN